MRCLLPLPVVVPCCAFSALATERIEGEIALSAPQCDLFVVQTGCGFSLLRQDSYYSIFEGDRIRACLHILGAQGVEVVVEGTLDVAIEERSLKLEQAKEIFYRRCRQY